MENKKKNVDLDVGDIIYRIYRNSGDWIAFKITEIEHNGDVVKMVLEDELLHKSRTVFINAHFFDDDSLSGFTTTEGEAGYDYWLDFEQPSRYADLAGKTNWQNGSWYVPKNK